ncbi:MAG TPA: hypothetical protein VEQ11_10875 [Chloroflexota bacterium]|nr:hypothetical protein [Chloroflexota bacterium]
MSELARWQPGHWGRPGRVAIAAGMLLDPNNETHAALQAVKVDVVQASLRDERGAISEAIADADVVISGGLAAERQRVRGLSAGSFPAAHRAARFLAP